jgi:hypothetical protein
MAAYSTGQNTAVGHTKADIEASMANDPESVLYFDLNKGPPRSASVLWIFLFLRTQEKYFSAKINLFDECNPQSKENDKNKHGVCRVKMN